MSADAERQLTDIEKQLLDAADASTHAGFVFDAIQAVVDEESGPLSESLSYLVGFAAKHGAALLARADEQLSSALRSLEQSKKGGAA